MRVAMKDGEADVLAGALSGRRALARLMERTAVEPDQPEPVFLDFQNVEVATASFLRESVVAFRDAVRGRRSNLYPIIANVNDLIAEELRVLVAANDVLLICSLDDQGRPHDSRIIGDLDPKQRLTFKLVQERRETDAAELMREFGEQEGVKQTAWNNRLSSLANLGLIVELSQGRAKRYRPLLTENHYGD